MLYEINPVSQRCVHHNHLLPHAGFFGCLRHDRLSQSEEQRKRKISHAAWAKAAHGGKDEGAEMGNLPKKLQSMKIPPMVKFDYELVPGGRSISWVFLVLSGALVGLAAGIMGVGGGFLTFPIFVYILGVSSMTTVGTDIFQIVFTAGYARHQPVCHLWIYFLHPGHGDAAGIADGYPDRRDGRPKW